MSDKASRWPFTPLQTAVLAVLAVVLCLVCGGSGTVLALYWNRLPVSGLAARPTPTPLPPMPTPTVTPILIPTPRPTVPLPQAAPTLAPTPTATYAVAPEFINRDKIREISQFVEQWRELSLPAPLPIEFLTRRQVAEQYRSESLDRETLEAIRTQQEFYRALGLLEPGVDLVEAALQSQADILLGYYNPDEQTMYIIAESVNMFAEEEMTYAHEYTHALQDHYFDLQTYLAQDVSADAQLAARALPEGDAKLVQDLFTYQNITRDQLEYTVYRYMFQEHPTLEGVSPALGIFTFFPYTAGEYFAIYLFFEGNFTWERVNQAYRNPPVSTEQVMHPEKYLAGERPVPITLPDLSPVLGGDWRELDRDVLGEAGFLVWLVDQIDQQTAIDAAAGWGGDAYTLWVNNQDQRVLASLSQWDAAGEAVEFVNAFAAYMDSREMDGGAKSYQDGPAQVWEYAGGVSLLSRRGAQVLIIVAPDVPTLNAVRGRFAGF
ncbi:MAG: hypothetical protein D6784_07285 [Chloroflexi bacterium]|nr:MAG: hypothetical protein D6784_07285 [Chloroflexota bacterium]